MCGKVNTWSREVAVHGANFGPRCYQKWDIHVFSVFKLQLVKLTRKWVDVGITYVRIIKNMRKKSQLTVMSFSNWQFLLDYYFTSNLCLGSQHSIRWQVGIFSTRSPGPLNENVGYTLCIILGLKKVWHY